MNIDQQILSDKNGWLRSNMEEEEGKKSVFFPLNKNHWILNTVKPSTIKFLLDGQPVFPTCRGPRIIESR